MQCPYCGAQLETGNVYCEVCGKEVQIVPDYDPLDELVIGQDKEPREAKKKEKLNTKPQGTPEKNEPEAVSSTLKLFSLKILGFAVGLLLCLVVLLAGYTSVSKENSYEYQLEKGMEAFDAERYEEAISFFKEAQKMQSGTEGADLTPLRYLARIYAVMNSPELAISCMEEAIAAEEAARGDNYALEELYLEYMDILNQVKRTRQIADVIENCKYEEIRQMLLPYRIEKPTFDTPEGEYAYYIRPELEAEYGVIYYTLDGTEPTAESTRYEGPISLEEGETLLSAVAINKKGMVSDKLVLVYKLNFDKNPIDENEEELAW